MYASLKSHSVNDVWRFAWKLHQRPEKGFFSGLFSDEAVRRNVKHRLPSVTSSLLLESFFKAKKFTPYSVSPTVCPFTRKLKNSVSTVRLQIPLYLSELACICPETKSNSPYTQELMFSYRQVVIFQALDKHVFVFIGQLGVGWTAGMLQCWACIEDKQTGEAIRILRCKRNEPTQHKTHNIPRLLLWIFWDSILSKKWKTKTVSNNPHRKWISAFKVGCQAKRKLYPEASNANSLNPAWSSWLFNFCVSRLKCSF